MFPYLNLLVIRFSTHANVFECFIRVLKRFEGIFGVFLSVQDVKGGMLCGGGLSDTKLSGDFVRLLSKLCRVSVPAPSKQTLSKSASSQQRRRKFESSNPTSLSWDPATSNATTREKVSIIGRHDSLKLLSERCSNAPAPSYNLHKPRKIRDHEPHQHFYKTISKTLDRKLKYVPYLPLIAFLHCRKIC